MMNENVNFETYSIVFPENFNDYIKSLEMDRKEIIYLPNEPKIPYLLFSVNAYFFWLCEHPGFLKPQLVDNIVARKPFRYVLPDNYIKYEDESEWTMVYKYEDIYEAAQKLEMTSKLTVKRMNTA